jgi:hypothetical protein
MAKTSHNYAKHRTTLSLCAAAILKGCVCSGYFSKHGRNADGSAFTGKLRNQHSPVSKTTIFIQGCYHYLSTIAGNCTFAGIVTFSTEARMEHEIVELTAANRESLINEIPTGVEGRTAIGKGKNWRVFMTYIKSRDLPGLLKGLEVLDLEGDVEGGHIILISDGGENEDPRIKDVFDTVKIFGIHRTRYTCFGSFFSLSH